MRKYEIHPFSLAVGGVVAVLILFACSSGSSSSPAVGPDLVSYHVKVTTGSTTPGWQAPVMILPSVPGGGLVITKMLYGRDETASSSVLGSIRLMENNTKTKFQHQVEASLGDEVDFGDGLKIGPGNSVSIQAHQKNLPSPFPSVIHITVIGYII